MTGQRLVGFHFYELDSFGIETWDNRLRGLAVRLVSRYVHCNYQIGPVVYDLSVHGLNVFENGYPVEPSLTLWVWVDEGDVRQFIGRFADDYQQSLPTLARMAVLTLAVVPLLSRWWKNCSLYPFELADGGARTPALLARKLSRRSVRRE